MIKSVALCHICRDYIPNATAGKALFLMTAPDQAPFVAERIFYRSVLNHPDDLHLCNRCLVGVQKISLDTMEKKQ